MFYKIITPLIIGILSLPKGFGYCIKKQANMNKKVAIVFAILLVFCFYKKGFSQDQVDVIDVLEILDNVHTNYDENPDSARILLTEALDYASIQSDSSAMVECLVDLSRLNMRNVEYKSSIEQVSQALFLAQKIKDTLLVAKCYNELSQIHLMFNRVEDALKYQQISHELKKYCSSKNCIRQGQLAFSYYAMSSMYKQLFKFDIALSYMDTCLAIVDTINTPINTRALYEIHISKIQIELGNHEAALVTLSKWRAYFENAMKISADKDSQYSLIFIYTHMGRSAQKLNQGQVALENYRKALVFIENDPKHIKHMIFLYERIAELQFSKGDYRDAYLSVVNARNLRSEHTGARSAAYNFLKLQNEYLSTLNAKEKELMAQDLELVQKQKSIFKIRAILAIVVLMLLITFLFARSRYNQIKRENDKKEADAYQKHTNEILELKNKELTAYILRLIEKEKLITKSVEYIKLHPDGPESLGLLNLLQKTSSNNWDEFSLRFSSVNQGFYDHLKTNFPELSNTELKHCALIKLNLSGKEMANLLAISEKGVYMSRYRIKKKLGLTKEKDLDTYLTTLEIE